MASTEIDSFVQKFKLLRNAGFEASLQFETKLGEVWISISCKVGRDVMPPPMPPPSSSQFVVASKLHRSPSYYRRLARRKAKREACVDDEKSMPPKADQDQIMQNAVEADNYNAVKESTHSTVVDSDASEDDIENELGERDAVMADVIEVDSVGTVVSNADADIGAQLDSIIRQSQTNRDLWDKFNALPP